MNDLLPKLYSEYGRYINQYRSFPSVLDGCKLVERRILFSIYQVAKDRLIKSAKVVGHALSYHPHADQSLYGSLCGLVKNGYIVGQGNFGSAAGVNIDPPAAMRYTEVKANSKLLDMAFEFIKDVPYEEVELDLEPVFLPTKLPLCLLRTEDDSVGMGFGYRTLIPRYKKQDLVKRLEWLLNGKKGTEPIPKPLSDCKIMSSTKELQDLFTKGKAQIQFQGRFSQTGRNSIVVTSIPPSRSFSVILKKFSKEISVEKSLGWQDESKTTTKVRFTIIRPRTLKMANLISKIKESLTGTMTYECNMCDTNGKVITVGIDKMLLTVYSIYKKIIQYVLKKKIKEIQNHIDELDLIARMKPYLSEQLKKNPDDIDFVIQEISQSLQVSQSVIKKICDKYVISRIFKIRTDTDKLKNEKSELQMNLSDLSNYVWKTKYSSI